MHYLHFKQQGGQHLPEWHTTFSKSSGKSFQIFTGGGVSMVRIIQLQDYFRFDSAILGLNDQYTTVCDDGFFINSPSIRTYNHTIITGHTYHLSRDKKDNVLQPVKLIDVFCDNMTLNLILQEINTGTSLIIGFEISNGFIKLPSWNLLDFAFLNMISENQCAFNCSI